LNGKRYRPALVLAVGCLLLATAASAQIGQVITDVRLEQEGRTLVEPTLAALVETRVGEPLSMRDVRETTAHLMSLGRFEDVQTLVEATAAGVRLRYVLVPLHPVDRIELRGNLGLAESQLRRLVQERFGRAPVAARQTEIADMLRANYRRRGFPSARVATRIEETHDPDRAALVLDIDAGSQAVIGSVQVIQVDQDQQGRVPFGPNVRVGQVYDADQVDAELQNWVQQMHQRRYYEARASHGPLFPDGSAHVTVNVALGPQVVVAFAGDPVPESEQARLVPVREEGSVDEDLLEDSSRAIEDYFMARGYRDATAPHASLEKGGQLTITFTVTRGPRYVVDTVTIAGHAAVTAAEIRQVLGVEEGSPFIPPALAAGVSAIQNIYRSRGFIRAQIVPVTAVLPPARPTDPDRAIDVRVDVVEGPRTVVRTVTFQGNTVIAEASLYDLITSAPGRVYTDIDAAADRDRIDLEYRNLGYDSIVVSAETRLADNDTQADITFTTSEGPQVVVDDVIIVGNGRTSTRTIERELLVRAGGPLGYSALIDSRTRLMALGLFSTVQIEPLGEPGATRRDLLVRVEEAPPTDISGGGGLEGGFILRTSEAGQAEERFELAPRGFFQIGRRNLWGKNRAVTLFTRVSLRSRDRVTDTAGGGVLTDSSYGFHEYRVVGTFREPRIFDSAADVLFTVSAEQARRSTYNFNRRLARAEAGLRLSPIYSLAGRYSFEHTKLVDEGISAEDRPLIDRIFPQVRLSKFSGSFIRDTRDDILDATSGRLVIVDGDLAARAIGSEVGFLRTFVQGFSFHRLPVQRPVVLALGGRLGAAHGFARAVGGDVVQDLPASERFFAGGESTVRGFSLDRLGNEQTISATGFPTGGNSVVVLNAELRVDVASRLQAVGFLDAGNVFPRVSNLDLTDLRAAIGFGVRIRTPFGPIRVDLGFNIDRRELGSGTRERGYVPHISLGQAF
jgi:outer membrane protein assembly factor BamA